MPGRRRDQELALFRRFAPAYPLPIDLASIEIREPQEPGILCSVEGFGLVAFELVEPIDEDLAESDARALSGDETAGGSYSERDPLFSNILRKLQKTYRSDASHIELLAYVHPTPAGSANKHVAGAPRTGGASPLTVRIRSSVGIRGPKPQG